MRLPARLAPPAPTTSAAATAATTASTAPAAAARPTGADRTRPCFVDRELAAIQLVLVELVDSRLRVLVGSHLDKSEPPRPTRGHVTHDPNRFDRPRLCEERLEIRFPRVVRKVPDEECSAPIHCLPRPVAPGPHGRAAVDGEELAGVDVHSTDDHVVRDESEGSVLSRRGGEGLTFQPIQPTRSHAGMQRSPYRTAVGTITGRLRDPSSGGVRCGTTDESRYLHASRWRFQRTSVALIWQCHSPAMTRRTVVSKVSALLACCAFTACAHLPPASQSALDREDAICVALAEYLQRYATTSPREQAAIAVDGRGASAAVIRRLQTPHLDVLPYNKGRCAETAMVSATLGEWSGTQGRVVVTNDPLPSTRCIALAWTRCTYDVKASAGTWTVADSTCEHFSVE